MIVNTSLKQYLDQFVRLLDVILLGDDDILHVAIRPMQRIAEQSPLDLQEIIQFLNYTIASLDVENAKKANNAIEKSVNPHDIVAVSYADYLSDKQRFISKLAELEMQLIQHTENHK